MIPHPQLLGIGPGLKVCARQLGPALSFARVSIHVLAQAADHAQVQRLIVHIFEQFVCRFLLPGFDHPLHRDAVQPEPDRAVVVGFILVIFLCQMVRMEERMMPIQGSRSPWIDQLLPGRPDGTVDEVAVPNHVEREQLVGTNREFRLIVLVEAVGQIVMLRIPIVLFKMLLQPVGNAAPPGRGLRIVHVLSKVNSRQQLVIPQRLNVICPGIAGRVGFQFSITGVHPGLVVVMKQIALIIRPVPNRTFNAVHHRRIQLGDNGCVARIFDVILKLDNKARCPVGRMVIDIFRRENIRNSAEVAGGLVGILVFGKRQQNIAGRLELPRYQHRSRKGDELVPAPVFIKPGKPRIDSVTLLPGHQLIHCNMQPVQGQGKRISAAFQIGIFAQKGCHALHPFFFQNITGSPYFLDQPCRFLCGLGRRDIETSRRSAGAHDFLLDIHRQTACRTDSNDPIPYRRCEKSKPVLFLLQSDLVAFKPNPDAIPCARKADLQNVDIIEHPQFLCQRAMLALQFVRVHPNLGLPIVQLQPVRPQLIAAEDFALVQIEALELRMLHMIIHMRLGIVIGRFLVGK
ncbi:hypothetical protein D3C81_702550 [compost metagenome]